MLFAAPGPNEPLSQADILDGCPIFGFDVSGGHVELDAGPARWHERVIVLTQACDLTQTKTTKVLVALVHPAHALVDRDSQSASDSRSSAPGARLRVVFPSGGPGRFPCPNRSSISTTCTRSRSLFWNA